VEALNAAVSQACFRLPYLPAEFRDDYYDWIDEETKSLKERNLFVTCLDYCGKAHSLFVNFLQDELKALGLFEEMEFTSHPWAAPRYAIPLPILGQIVGLDRNQDAHRDILQNIQNGQIDLRQVWEKKEAVGEEDYRRWLNEEYRAVEEEMARLVSSFEL
jgi:hypothetical protein